MLIQLYLEQWKNLNVLVIGEAMLDRYYYGTADRLCQEAPVPIVNLNNQEHMPGGAANTAANLRSWGATVDFLSVIGNDQGGINLKDSLEKRGISTQYLYCDLTRKTLIKQRFFSGNQMLLRCDQGTQDLISVEAEQQLIDGLILNFDTCDAVIISDYNYGIITPQIILTLTQLQNKTPKIIVVDSKNLNNYQSIGITAIKPNYAETIQCLGLPKLTGKSRIQQILTTEEILLNLTNSELIAVTLDADGTILFQRDYPPYIIPTQPTSQTQTTGAGDTFVSSLTLALASGADAQSAALIASEITALVINKTGTKTCSLDSRMGYAHQSSKIQESEVCLSEVRSQNNF